MAYQVLWKQRHHQDVYRVLVNMASSSRFPLAAKNMEPLHGLSPNPAPISLSASQATSPTRDFMVLWRNRNFPFSEPKKPAFSQRRCKIRTRPWARGNFDTCYTMV